MSDEVLGLRFVHAIQHEMEANGLKAKHIEGFWANKYEGCVVLRTPHGVVSLYVNGLYGLMIPVTQMVKYAFWTGKQGAPPMHARWGRSRCSYTNTLPSWVELPVSVSQEAQREALLSGTLLPLRLLRYVEPSAKLTPLTIDALTWRKE